MLTENAQNIITTKKTKKNKVFKNFGCIAEFKKRAILKFCNENGTKRSQYDEILNSNVLSEIGIC